MFELVRVQDSSKLATLIKNQHLQKHDEVCHPFVYRRVSGARGIGSVTVEANHGSKGAATSAIPSLSINIPGMHLGVLA
jgi:hypothetical protein